MPKPKKDQQQTEGERSHAETKRIREATLKTLLNTPPKPHAEMIEDRRKGCKK